MVPVPTAADPIHPPCVRVVAVAAKSPSPRADWRQLAEVVALAAVASPTAALLLDLRGESFDVDGRLADVLAQALASYPTVTLLVETGHSLGCARMVAMRIELRGASASAFTDEHEAWRWLSAALGSDHARACL